MERRKKKKKDKEQRKAGRSCCESPRAIKLFAWVQYQERWIKNSSEDLEWGWGGRVKALKQIDCISLLAQIRRAEGGRQEINRCSERSPACRQGRVKTAFYESQETKSQGCQWYNNAQCLEGKGLLNHSGVPPPQDLNVKGWCLLKGSFTDRKNKPEVYTYLCLMQMAYLNLITWSLRWFLFPPFFLISTLQLWFALYQRFVHFKTLSGIKIKCSRTLMISLWLRVLSSQQC